MPPFLSLQCSLLRAASCATTSLSFIRTASRATASLRSICAISPTPPPEAVRLIPSSSSSLLSSSHLEPSTSLRRALLLSLARALKSDPIYLPLLSRLPFLLFCPPSLLILLFLLSTPLSPSSNPPSLPRCQHALRHLRLAPSHPPLQQNPTSLRPFYFAMLSLQKRNHALEQWTKAEESKKSLAVECAKHKNLVDQLEAKVTEHIRELKRLEEEKIEALRDKEISAGEYASIKKACSTVKKLNDDLMTKLISVEEAVKVLENKNNTLSKDLAVNKNILKCARVDRDNAEAKRDEIITKLASCQEELGLRS
ncbi:hypothetical protein J5N97_013507 [Dioscorea zingiberensis]|uniref:Uncharacterized protein n=1 Tax=Dioscorea zingiberensis TaxID=325984 RepID=A0A9D5HIV3_9LILI|nr:hypothetical protein J5N97_013507 [Dioscorea zingiberensis]